ncbi:MAG: ATP-binding protein [Pirellulales bacterium]
MRRTRSRRFTLTTAAVAVAVSGIPAVVRIGPEELAVTLPFVVAALFMTLLGAWHARLVACVAVLTACCPVLTAKPEERLESVRNTLFVSVAMWGLAWAHHRQRTRLQKRTRARRRMVGRVRRHARRLEQTGTELRRRMEQTQAAQATLLEHLPVHVLQKDREGRFTFVSQSFAKLLGQDSEKIVGHTDYDYYSQTIADKFRQDDQRVVNEGAIIDDVERTQLADGSVGYMQVRKAPLRNSAWEIIGVQGIFWDVTKEFSGRMQLQRIESLAHALIQAALDAVLIVDAQGRVLEANPASSSILGYSQEFGSEHPPLGDIMHGIADVSGAEPSEVNALTVKSLEQNAYVQESAHQEQVQGQITRLLKQATGTRIEVRLRRRDDTWFDAEISAHPLAVENSSGWAIFIRDITRRKRSVAELQSAKDAAEKANLAKSEFVANVSHELRTPLTGIVGLHELLERSALDDQQREYVTLAQKSSGNLLALIDALLDFSKIEAQKLEFEQSEFDLPECVESAADSLAARAQLRGLELVVDIDPKVPRRVIGDSHRVRQILLNLIGNAIKFTHRGDIMVRVHQEIDPREEATAEPSMIRFDVIDAGIGIAEEHLEAIFEPFRQADNSSTRKYGGTGLGLAICSELVKLMGGRISVASRPDEGSTFTFVLPLSPCDTAAASPSVSYVRERAMSDWDTAVIAAQPSRWCEVLGRDLEARGLSVRRLSPGEVISRKPAELFAAGNRTLLFADYRELSTTAPSSLPVCARLVLCLPLAAPRPSQMPNWARHADVRWLARPIHQADLDSVLLLTEQTNADRLHDSSSIYEHNAVSAHVLLVEDSSINQAVLAGMLRQLGHQVTVAGSGADAVSKCASKSFDVVLMDIQMPEVDGLEATRRIRAEEAGLAGVDRSSATIIALTAHAMPSDREQCIAAGMDDFLVKPIPLDRLRDAINRALERVRERPTQLALTSTQTLLPNTEMESPADRESGESVASDDSSSPLPSSSDEIVMPVLEDVVETLGGNRTLAIDVLKLLRTEVPRLQRELERSVHDRVTKNARRAAHTLKSNLRNVCLKEDAKVLGAMEDAIIAERWDEVDALWTRQQPRFHLIKVWTEQLLGG